MNAITSMISNAMVQIVHQHTGRGPTKSQSVVAPDAVLVILRDCLTHSERQLVDEGQANAVLAIRQAFQESMADEMITAVEQVTGRRVEALLSATLLEPDITVNVFIAPEKVVPRA